MLVGFNYPFPSRQKHGAKGANLIIMTRLGLPVPEGFILPVGAEIEEKAVINRFRKLKTAVSVRSSGAISMPGMMDTFLDVKDEKTLLESIFLVRRSWYSERAMEYRSTKGIPHDPPLVAVIIQKMVYGDKDNRSGTGVLFTRHPVTGKKEMFGDFVQQAKGDDVVLGRVIPKPLDFLKTLMPEVYRQLEHYGQFLESYFKDAQDIEFTIESGRLWLLQTRSIAGDLKSSIEIIRNLHKNGIIDWSEAHLRFRKLMWKECQKE